MNTEKNLVMAERIQKLMEKYACTISQAVLGSFTQQEFACVPLYGPQNAEQLKDAMKTLEIKFEKEDYKI